MTIYKADQAARPRPPPKAAIALANGKKPTGHRPTTARACPSTILDPVAVTKDNVKDTVVKDGFYKVGDICTALRAACAQPACSRQAPAVRS